MAFSSSKLRLGLGAGVLRWWVIICAVVAVALCLSQLLEIPARSALRGYDNTFNYLWLRSAVVDRDWDFRNDLVACTTLTPEYRKAALELPLTRQGLIPNKYGIGWAVITLPFYGLADVIVSLGRELGWWNLANDGFNPIYQICIQIGHAGLGLWALTLAVRTIAFWLDDGKGRPAPRLRSDGSHTDGGFGPRSPSPETFAAAIGGVVTVWAASPLIYYQSVNVSMSHGAAFFAVAVMAYALARSSREPENLRWWVLAGIGWGLAVTIRYQLAVFALPLVWNLFRLGRDRSRLGRALMGQVLGAAPFLALQAVAWRVVYGEWFLFSYGAEGESFRWGNPAIGSSLFSPWHGLFYWHPFLLVAAAALMGWTWTARRAATPWTLAFGLLLYTNAAWWCWWFASAFGNRGYDAALLPLMAGVAWLLLRLRGRWRTAFGLIAVTLGLWNFYVLLLYRSGAISRSAPVSWPEMLNAATRLGEAVKF